MPAYHGVVNEHVGYSWIAAKNSTKSVILMDCDGVAIKIS
jgi:hypothetical protein